MPQEVLLSEGDAIINENGELSGESLVSNRTLAEPGLSAGSNALSRGSGGAELDRPMETILGLSCFIDTRIAVSRTGVDETSVPDLESPSADKESDNVEISLLSCRLPKIEAGTDSFTPELDGDSGVTGMISQGSGVLFKKSARPRTFCHLDCFRDPFCRLILAEVVDKTAVGIPHTIEIKAKFCVD